MPRVLLKKEGIPLNSMTFAATEAGKPYIVRAKHVISFATIFEEDAPLTDYAWY